MSYRIPLPGNKPELEFAFDTLLSNPFKGFEINDKSLVQRIGYYGSDLVDAGVLDILYNRKRKSTTVMVKTDYYKKKKGRGRSIEYIVGDRINNTLIIPKPVVNIPRVRL
jgi:hypothetical protein